MRIDVLTLFPEMFTAMNSSIVGRAQENNFVEINLHNFRDYADNKQKHVDDYPYGGDTAGMLLMVQPIFDNLAQIERQTTNLKKRVILLDPTGETFTQQKAEELAQEEQLILICGHYEGVDERVKTVVTDEISIGDYVLTGGELPAMAIIDAVTRLLPKVLGNDDSAKDDSHSSGLLEGAQYTRPANFRGLAVPAELLSGDHEKIRKWRLFNSLAKTYHQRPSMLANLKLTDEMREMLEQIKENEYS